MLAPASVFRTNCLLRGLRIGLLASRSIDETRMPKRPSWKYLELVTAFGGDQQVVDIIRAEGFDPPALTTVTAWRTRNSIPSRWAPLIIDLALRRGLLDHVSQLRKGA